MSRTDSSGRARVAINRAGIIGAAAFMPAAVPYAANDIIDVAKAIAFTDADGAAVPPGSLIHIRAAVLKIDVAALQAAEAGYQLQCFGVTPPSALADNAAWTISAADLVVYQGAIGLGVPVDIGAALYVKTVLDLTFKLTTSSLFAQLQTLAGFTPTAVARQVTLMGEVI